MLQTADSKTILAHLLCVGGHLLCVGAHLLCVGGPVLNMSLAAALVGQRFGLFADKWQPRTCFFNY